MGGKNNKPCLSIEQISKNAMFSINKCAFTNSMVLWDPTTQCGSYGCLLIINTFKVSYKQLLFYYLITRFSVKIFVTGGAGFIGSAVIRHIINNTNDNVVNIDKLTYAGNLESLSPVSESSNYIFVQADICDRSYETTI